MSGKISENLQKKVAERLTFYDDLGIGLFYRDRLPESIARRVALPESVEKAAGPAQIVHEESALPKPLPKTEFQKRAAPAQKMAPLPLPAAPGPSLFEAADKI